MENNDQIEENAEKNVGTKKMLSVALLKTTKMHPLKWFWKIMKSILNVILFSNMHNFVMGNININYLK